MSGPRLGVAVLVTDAQGRLLLGRRGKQPNRGLWVLPGGGVKFGEFWYQTAKRELLEETGLDVRVDLTARPFVLEIMSGDETAITEHRVILYTTGSVDNETPTPSSDLLEARFFGRDELPADISPAVQPVLIEFGWKLPV